LTARETLKWWREERTALLEVLAKMDRKKRLPWYGPALSAMSFATARLMMKIPRPISGGLMLSYKCQAECRHCMYACSPKWAGDWITVDQLDPQEVVDTMVALVEAETTELSNPVPPNIIELITGSRG